MMTCGWKDAQPRFAVGSTPHLRRRCISQRSVVIDEAGSCASVCGAVRSVTMAPLIRPCSSNACWDKILSPRQRQSIGRMPGWPSGGLDEMLWYTGDWDIWLKLAAQGPVYHHREVTTAFRVHRASLTITGSRDGADFEQQMRTVLDRHLPSLRCDIGQRSRGAQALRRSRSMVRWLLRHRGAGTAASCVRPSAGAWSGRHPSLHPGFTDHRSADASRARQTHGILLSMSIGGTIRRLFGPFERQISEGYRAIYLDVDAYAAGLAAGCLTRAASSKLAAVRVPSVSGLPPSIPNAEIAAIDITPNVGRLYAGAAGRVRSPK